MKINVKATGTGLANAVHDRIEKICARLEKLANAFDPDSLECDIEVGKITRHHRKGNIYRAEIHFAAAGKYFRAVAEGETETAALDVAHDEIKHAFVHSKHKKQSVARRSGARIKKLTQES